MKKRLLEDIAASSNSSLIKIIMAGEEDDLEMRMRFISVLIIS